MKFVGELKYKDFYKFNFHCKFTFANCLITIKYKKYIYKYKK